MTRREKIAGCLYGYAIGDALGLGTEYMNKRQISRRYPEGLRNYDMIISDAHRSQWPKGGYTFDTYWVLELIDSISACGKYDHMDYARRLSEWYGHSQTFDLESHWRFILPDKDFLTDPHAVSKRFYDAQSGRVPTNEFFGRTMVLGIFSDVDELKENVRNDVFLTHNHPACHASAAVISNVAHDLYWRNHEPDRDLLYGIMQRIYPEGKEWLDMAFEGRLSDMVLDDTEGQMYCMRNMSVALWALKHQSDPLTALYAVVDEGGDADTNAALSLGLMGLKYGIWSLPPKAIEGMVAHEKVEAGIDKFFNLLEEKTGNSVVN